MLIKVIAVVLAGFVVYLLFFKNKRVDGVKKNDKLTAESNGKMLLVVLLYLLKRLL